MPTLASCRSGHLRGGGRRHLDAMPHRVHRTPRLPLPLLEVTQAPRSFPLRAHGPCQSTPRVVATPRSTKRAARLRTAPPCLSCSISSTASYTSTIASLVNSNAPYPSPAHAPVLAVRHGEQSTAPKLTRHLCLPPTNRPPLHHPLASSDLPDTSSRTPHLSSPLCTAVPWSTASSLRYKNHPRTPSLPHTSPQPLPHHHSLPCIARRASTPLKSP